MDLPSEGVNYAAPSQIQPVINPSTAAYLSGLNGIVLEVGCGPAQYRPFLRGRYLGVDVTKADYGALPRRPDVVATAEALPFANEAFDAVFFSNVFYHFRDGARELTEALRVLRPGGVILLFDYSRPTLDRLRCAYAATGQRETALVRSCADWRSMCAAASLIDARVRGNTRTLRNKLAQLLPRMLCYAILDRRNMPVVISAVKPPA